MMNGLGNKLLINRQATINTKMGRSLTMWCAIGANGTFSLRHSHLVKGAIA
jgi:hypothetical protein